MNKTKEITIFNCLKDDSRRKIQDISRETKIPVSTAHEMIIRLRNEKIKKFTIIPNYQNLGLGTHAIVIMQTSNEYRENLKKFLKNYPMVNSFYVIDGRSFFIEIFSKNNDSLNSFIRRIENDYKIINHEVHMVFEEVKTEGFKLEFN